MFPFYLSIGMSSAEYWEGDSTLARYFRKAYELKQEQDDYTAWLNGLYVYDAVQTALYNGFKSKNQTTRKYPEKPYMQTERELKSEDSAKREDEKIINWMENLVTFYGNKQ